MTTIGIVVQSVAQTPAEAYRRSRVAILNQSAADCQPRPSALWTPPHAQLDEKTLRNRRQ
ncbi:MAG: hypothetical protein J7551_06260 [Chloroflexi bacterium]|nr:hypothetical protein [Chloroflexota bacterium]